jgi:hypothetical protein
MVIYMTQTSLILDVLDEIPVVTMRLRREVRTLEMRWAGLRAVSVTRLQVVEDSDFTRTAYFGLGTDVIFTFQDIDPVLMRLHVPS